MKYLRRLDATVHDSESLSLIFDGMNTKWHDLCFSSLQIKEGCEFTSLEEGSTILKNVFTCSNLNRLWIAVPIRKLPEECRSQLVFPTLISLDLITCQIEDDPMEILEKLLCLEWLGLWMRSFVGEEMICLAMGFPQLKTLQLEKLPNLREWRVEKGAMPIPYKIGINCCPDLEMIPDGLRFIATLQELMIVRMPELGKQLLALGDDGGQEGEDFDKVLHVPSIMIYNPVE